MKSQERNAPVVERFFHEGLAQLDITLPDHLVHQLVLYCLELEKWNRKVNLVARNTSLRDLVEKHFLDSLALIPVLREFDRLQGPLLDVGSGAGFPGLVVKTACPSIVTVLLEPRQKRAAFLKHIVRILSLGGIDVLAGRTEDMEGLSAYDFSVITGRAVAEVSGFIELVARHASQQTLVICMQGTTGRKKWQKKDRVNGFECVGVRETILPFSQVNRYFLIFKKIS